MPAFLYTDSGYSRICFALFSLSIFSLPLCLGSSSDTQILLVSFPVFSQKIYRIDTAASWITFGFPREKKGVGE